MQRITLIAVRAGAGSVRLCVYSDTELRWSLEVSFWISLTTRSVFCSLSGNFQLLNSEQFFKNVLHHLCCITMYVETVTCELCFSITF